MVTFLTAFEPVTFGVGGGGVLVTGFGEGALMGVLAGFALGRPRFGRLLGDWPLGEGEIGLGATSGVFRTASTDGDEMGDGSSSATLDALARVDRVDLTLLDDLVLFDDFFLPLGFAGELSSGSESVLGAASGSWTFSTAKDSLAFSSFS